MSEFKLTLKIIFLSLSFFVLSSHSFLLFGQEESNRLLSEKEGAYAQGIGQEECSKNFNISKVNLNDSKVVLFVPRLTEYFQCRSAAKDSLGECDNLASCASCVDNCRLNFNNIHAFFGKLLRSKTITSSMSGMREGFGSKEEFDLVVRGLLENDISVCEKIPSDKQSECKAVASGDLQYCNSEDCLNLVAYIKAIKSGKVEDCDKIQYSSMRALCQGYISKDEKICEKNVGFAQFKDAYCE